MNDDVEVGPDEAAPRPRPAARRRPRIVAVLAPKGGVGKTTVSMGLLVAARQAGLRAVGIGMDAQRSLEVWAAAREKQRVRPGGAAYLDVSVTTLALHDWRRLSSLADVDLAVLDTAPGHLDDITAVEGVAKLADLIVIPTSPSMQDLFQVRAFHKRLASRKSFFVLNRVNRRTRSYTAAREMLMRSGQLCSVDIPDRDAVGVEYAKGLVLADNRLSGSEFFDGLWNFIAGQLDLPPLRGDEGEDDHAA